MADLEISVAMPIDLDGLDSLDALSKLKLSLGQTQADNIDQIGELKDLKRLILAGSEGVKALRYLNEDSKVSITHLTLGSDGGYTNLKALKDFTKLQHLYVHEFPKLKEIETLQTLVQLRSIRLDHTSDIQLPELSNLTQLEYLGIQGKNIKALGDLPASLRTLSLIGGNRVKRLLEPTVD